MHFEVLFWSQKRVLSVLVCTFGRLARERHMKATVELVKFSKSAKFVGSAKWTVLVKSVKFVKLVKSGKSVRCVRWVRIVSLVEVVKIVKLVATAPEALAHSAVE